MKVVLLEDVRKVGKKGDVVNVSDGYGQNFLIKNKLAVKETAGAKKILEQQKEEARLQDIENKKNAEALKEKIEGITLEFVLKSGKDGNDEFMFTIFDRSGKSFHHLEYCLD